jgi:hypothetical protein
VTDMPIPLRLSLSPICLSPYWLNSSVIFSPGDVKKGVCADDLWPRHQVLSGIFEMRFVIHRLLFYEE